MKFVLILLGVICLTTFAVAGDIEFVDDSDLIHLLTKGDNVVALFTKKNCPECVELENILSRIGQELQEQLGCVVVKAENSHMVNLYNPKKEPSLIFFRQGIPLLYSGNYNAEDILELFNNNKEPVVKELSDENFEHLTQAATGATTGDWFIFFYSPDCVLCQRLYAIWESVGARLRNRLNVARVNRAERGVSTAQRFQITKSPEFIFIRSGKFYRYKSQDYTANSFVKFASGGYVKDSSMEAVPGLPSFIDEVVADQLRFVQENQIYVIIGVGILVLLLVIVKRLRSTKKVDPAKKKEKSKNK